MKLPHFNVCPNFVVALKRYCKVNQTITKKSNFQYTSTHGKWRTQDFSMGGGSVTSHRDDVTILQLQ